MDKRDYYEVLGVSKGSDEKTLKKAYRNLVKELHPDRNDAEDAETKFKEVQEAYEVLSDPSKKAAYDQYGHAGAGFGGASGAGAGFGGFDFGDAPFDMGDIFSQFFGGGMGGGRQRERKGSDLRYRIKLSFLEAIHGGQFDLNLDREVACEHCDGTGSEDKKTKTCDTCKGQGKVQKVQNSFLGQMAFVTECEECNGEGSIPEKKCEECHGRGTESKKEMFKVKVPEGSFDGMILRFRGGGSEAKGDIPAGDLFIELDVEVDENLERRGNDIYSEEDIDMYMATLGGEIKVNTVHGNVKLKIPNGTQPNAVFRIKEKGSPFLQEEGKIGDHYVRVNVVIPKKLSKKEKKAFEELRD